jgi:hypothetical protein
MAGGAATAPPDPPKPPGETIGAGAPIGIGGVVGICVQLTKITEDKKRRMNGALGRERNPIATSPLGESYVPPRWFPTGFRPFSVKAL